jgi:hypothetical protein
MYLLILQLFLSVNLWINKDQVSNEMKISFEIYKKYNITYNFRYYKIELIHLICLCLIFNAGSNRLIKTNDIYLSEIKQTNKTCIFIFSHIEQMSILFLFNDLTTLINYNLYSSCIYDIACSTYLIRLLLTKIKIKWIFFHLLVQISK